MQPAFSFGGDFFDQFGQLPTLKTPLPGARNAEYWRTLDSPLSSLLMALATFGAGFVMLFRKAGMNQVGFTTLRRRSIDARKGS
ncbi:hypothetical protein [Collimonas sp. OK307]|uniref:hypothetical protein n=1 Tax=Collimonas sp. OK307 TaxID=1801620 RepID=UPI001586FE0B|nr:hypothetical protein [Collimonas sp. OK307]